MKIYNQLKELFFLYVQGKVSTDEFLGFIKNRPELLYVLSNEDYDNLNVLDKEEDPNLCLKTIKQILFCYFKEVDCEKENILNVLRALIVDLNDWDLIFTSLKTIGNLYNSGFRILEPIAQKYVIELNKEYNGKEKATLIEKFMPRLFIDTKELIHHIENQAYIKSCC